LNKLYRFDTTEVASAARGGQGKTIGEVTETAVKKGLSKEQQNRLKELEARENGNGSQRSGKMN